MNTLDNALENVAREMPVSTPEIAEGGSSNSEISGQPNSSPAPIPSSAPTTPELTDPGTPDLLTTHHGILCDGKDCPQGDKFTGIRYKCTFCVDTDFCTACEPNHEPTHARLMYRVNKANTLPAKDEPLFPHLLFYDKESENGSAEEGQSGTPPKAAEAVEETYDDMIRRMERLCNEDEENLIKNIADLSKTHFIYDIFKLQRQ